MNMKLCVFVATILGSAYVCCTNAETNTPGRRTEDDFVSARIEKCDGDWVQGVPLWLVVVFTNRSQVAMDGPTSIGVRGEYEINGYSLQLEHRLYKGWILFAKELASYQRGSGIDAERRWPPIRIKPYSSCRIAWRLEWPGDVKPADYTMNIRFRRHTRGLATICSTNMNITVRRPTLEERRWIEQGLPRVPGTWYEMPVPATPMPASFVQSMAFEVLVRTVVGLRTPINEMDANALLNSECGIFGAEVSAMAYEILTAQKKTDEASALRKSAEKRWPGADTLFESAGMIQRLRWYCGPDTEIGRMWREKSGGDTKIGTQAPGEVKAP